MSSDDDNTVSAFPIDARVELHGLVKAPELNGQLGVIQSALATNGRQTVYIDELAKSVGLKPNNLEYQALDIHSLTAKELKRILKARGEHPESALTGVDKADLKAKLAGVSGEELAELLAAGTGNKTTAANSSSSPSSSSNATLQQARQAADQLANMSPEQLRHQAQMMRSMHPDQVRRMNPQLAHMSDAQIQMAASQMEMMANNPHMMKMATEQVQNMSPAELEQMQAQLKGNGGGGATAAAATSSATSSTTTSTTNQAQQAANMMANMTPEQLRQQANAMKSMTPDAIRRMNPQLAHMTDAQIRAAVAQFEMMASNPDMLKMAVDQMKHMTPEQMANLQSQGAASGGTTGIPDNMGGDPAKFLANMDKGQLKSMMRSLQENPEMLQNFAASSGLSPEQLKQGVDMFANMDDAKLDAAINVMGKVQKAKDVWTTADAKTGGHLKKLVALGAIMLVYLLVYLVVLRSRGGDVVSAVPSAPDSNGIPEIPVAATPEVEDEFASEF